MKCDNMESNGMQQCIVCYQLDGNGVGAMCVVMQPNEMADVQGRVESKTIKRRQHSKQQNWAPHAARTIDGTLPHFKQGLKKYFPLSFTPIGHLQPCQIC